MSRTSASRATGQYFSPLGLICTALGAAMVFSQRVVEKSLERRWNDAWTVAWYVVAGLLLWWGITNVVSRKRAARLGLMRHRMALPRPGLVYIGILVVMLTGSLLGRSNMLMLVFALMAGPFVLNGWITFSMLRRIRVTRAVPTRVMAGELASVDVTLENRRFLLASWLMAVTDRIVNTREELQAEVIFARVPGRTTRVASYQVRLMQRGRYFFGPLHVATSFPLGLVERGLVIPAANEIVVFPRLGRLAPRWKQEHLLAAELAQQQQLRRGVFDDEFHAIREYRSGDNPRAIHWRTSARQNQLMVREFHQNRDRNLLVLLDLWQPARPTSEDRDRVELAVSLAATICVDTMRVSRDARFELGAAGAEFQRWEGRSSPAGVDSLLEMLALMAPSPAPDLSRLRERAGSRASTATRTLLVTTRRLANAGDEFRRLWIGGNGSSESVPDARVIEVDAGSIESFFQLE